MYQKIGNVTLKTGESVELGVVTSPDLEWSPKLDHLLGHKGEPWVWQIHQCLTKSDLDLETRCYVLSRDGVPFANICTFEHGGVGIFGHVFTVPADRKKGAADLLNRQVMADFDARGGCALYLGTSYNTPPYFIYQKYGFASVEPESGYMVWTREGKAGFEKHYFAPGPVTVESLAFRHWPTLPALAMMDHPARLRIASMKITQPISTEGGVLELLKDAHDKKQPIPARVAVSKSSGAPIAFLCRGLDYYFGSRVDLLDVFFAPGFETETLAMVRDFPLAADRKTICYSDSLFPEKDHLLRAAGFAPEAVLRNHLAWGSRTLDVTLWTKI